MKLLENVWKKPTILITKTAAEKMSELVEQSPKEIGWHGIVETSGNNEYIIKDIIMFPQYVTGTTVTPEEDEYFEWLDNIFKETPEIGNAIRFHGHSHVHMAVSPSGVDMTYRESLTSMIMATDENPFYIFMILNKKKDYSLELYDKKAGIIYDEKDVTIINEQNEEAEWAENAIKQYVKEKTYKCSTTPKASNFSIQEQCKTEKYTLSEQEQLEALCRNYLYD